MSLPIRVPAAGDVHGHRLAKTCVEIIQEGARMTTHPRLKGAVAAVVLMLAVATGACLTSTDSAQPTSVGASPSATARPTPAFTPTPTPEPTPAPSSWEGGH